MNVSFRVNRPPRFTHLLCARGCTRCRIPLSIPPSAHNTPSQAHTQSSLLPCFFPKSLLANYTSPPPPPPNPPSPHTHTNVHTFHTHTHTHTHTQSDTESESLHACSTGSLHGYFRIGPTLLWRNIASPPSGPDGANGEQRLFLQPLSPR